MSAPDPRPIAGEYVRLRTGDLETLAQVVTVDDDTVVLDLADGGDGTGEIVFSHPRGVIGLEGRLAPGGEHVVFSITDSKRLEQRRGAYRLAIVCPVEIARIGRERLVGRTGDLSISGVRILDAPELEAEEHVQLRIQLEDQGVIEVAGEIVRCEGDSRGVHFDGLSRGAEDLLARFIASSQRRVLVRA